MIAVAQAFLVGSTYIPFLYGWWLPIVPAAMAAIGSAAAVTAYLAHTASDIRKTFGRYLSDEIVTTLLENPEGQKLGGERREITILTSDLRGFTSTSERLPPEKVIEVLNFYLGRMAESITRYNGTIDEFMGDGILILFGAPIRREDDTQRAIACAVDMQLQMATVNQQMVDWGMPPLEMGIGIHTGEVVVGNIGSEKRTKYGIVGNHVNLTYRIESFTTGGQIYISHAALRAAGDMTVQIAGQQIVMPKGVAEPITIHDVVGVGAPYNLALSQEEETFMPLASALPVCFSLVHSKQVDDALLTGQVIELSEKSALIRASELIVNQVEALNNIKLNFLSLGGAIESIDVYAKVVNKAAALSQFYIRFTSVPPTVATQLDALKATSSVETPQAT